MEAIGEVMPEESLQAVRREYLSRAIVKLSNDIIRKRKIHEGSNNSQEIKPRSVKD